jgi:hypothetical protein
MNKYFWSLVKTIEVLQWTLGLSNYQLESWFVFFIIDSWKSTSNQFLPNHSSTVNIAQLFDCNVYCHVVAMTMKCVVFWFDAYMWRHHCIIWLFCLGINIPRHEEERIRIKRLLFESWAVRIIVLSCRPLLFIFLYFQVCSWKKKNPMVTYTVDEINLE